MPVSISILPDEQRMSLYFSGNLDISVTSRICEACDKLPFGIKECVLDLTGVERIFDSGLALLRMLCQRLRRVGASISIRGDLSEITRRFPAALVLG
jgi:ABC-type transporter Mla MlaB component